MDGIDGSRGGGGVRQRQHRIVPRYMYPVPLVCFCLSHRQHINLVLTYLVLVRLVDPRFITLHTIWKRCDGGYIFLRCTNGFIEQTQSQQQEYVPYRVVVDDVAHE